MERLCLLVSRQWTLKRNFENNYYKYLLDLQWNPDYSNPRFLKNPDNSNQKLFPLDLFHCNFTPDILNSRFLEPILSGFHCIFKTVQGLNHKTCTTHWSQEFYFASNGHKCPNCFFSSPSPSFSALIPKLWWSLFCLVPLSFFKSLLYCTSRNSVLCWSSSSWRCSWRALVRLMSCSSSLRNSRFSSLILCVCSSRHCFAS